MKNFIKLGILLISCLFLFTTCKQKDDDPLQPAYLFQSGGYIKGTITGVSADGIALSESFNYSIFGNKTDATASSTLTGYSFYLYRGDPNNDGCYIEIQFDWTLTGVVSNPDIAIRYVKEMTNHQLLVYNPGFGAITPDITNVVFNSGTNTLTGSFSATVKMTGGSGVEHDSTISGDFNLTVYQVVSK